jgi:hypothetical protein
MNKFEAEDFAIIGGAIGLVEDLLYEEDKKVENELQREENELYNVDEKNEENYETETDGKIQKIKRLDTTMFNMVKTIILNQIKKKNINDMDEEEKHLFNQAIQFEDKKDLL